MPENGFTGQRFEASVGIYDYNARWYDPGIAKFVQPDAVARAYDPQGLGPYSYVRNDPVNQVDPSGNDSIDCPGGICFGDGPNIHVSFGWGGNFYGQGGFGFAGCINFIPGSCSGSGGWFIFSSQQIEQAVGKINSQVGMIFSVLRDPVGAIVGTVEGVFNSIFNPPFDYPIAISLGDGSAEISGDYPSGLIAEIDKWIRKEHPEAVPEGDVNVIGVGWWPRDGTSLKSNARWLYDDTVILRRDSDLGDSPVGRIYVTSVLSHEYLHLRHPDWTEEQVVRESLRIGTDFAIRDVK